MLACVKVDENKPGNATASESNRVQFIFQIMLALSRSLTKATNYLIYKCRSWYFKITALLSGSPFVFRT